VADSGKPAQAGPVGNDAGRWTIEDLGAALRQLRRRQARHRGGPPLTYRELAVKTGWAVGAIADYFNGRVLAPTNRFDVLVQLLDATPVEQGALATARDRIEEARRVASEHRALPNHRPVPRQLPADVFAFSGRAGELATLDVLADPDRGPAICAITGTAGVGKTALALHWAHRVADRYPDGQLYANLRGFDAGGAVMDPSEAVRRFLDALAVPPQRIPPDVDAQSALYRSLLAGRRVLVVLDNARDAHQIRPLLPGTTACMVLVTSRNQLTGLVAADGAHCIALDLLTVEDARLLLARRLGDERVTSQPGAVQEIVLGALDSPWRWCSWLRVPSPILGSRSPPWRRS